MTFLSEFAYMTSAPDTREEAAAKLPALHVLMAMGYTYVSPLDALAMRGSERSVLLESILRDRLARYRFDHRGKSHPLSTASVDEVIRTLASTGLSENAYRGSRLALRSACRKWRSDGEVARRKARSS